MKRRTYRVLWTSRWGETFVVAEGVPSDIADQLFMGITTVYLLYEWVRVWIETSDGKVVDEERRPAFVG